MVCRRRVASAFLIASFLSVTFAVARAGEPRALLELFTSQGCSSCPAADRLMGQLAKDPALVALSVPVDYWDYLGWRDTLANPAHSARQRAYARVRGDGQVYTPQIVVNGAVDALGSDQTAVEQAIAETTKESSVMSVPIALSVSGSALSVKVPSAETSEQAAAEVWLCPVARTVAVAIARGENRGRTITYHNVVRNWVKLGDWKGAQSTWDVPLPQIKAAGIDAAAVVLQEGTLERPGIVLGAALTPLQ
jgi:hypothetical protein